MDPNSASSTPAIDGDYHLLDFSPCLETGDYYNRPSIDLDYNYRSFPIGTDPDVGAYEDSPGDLTAWWPFDMILKSFPPKAPEIINNNTGTIYGPTGSPLVTGVFEQGHTFTGGRYVSAADDDTLDFGTGDMTISLWVKTSTNGRAIIDKRQSASSESGRIGYHVFIYSGRLLFQMNDGFGHSNYYNLSSPIITDNEWHMLSITVDRSVNDIGHLYVDGDEVYTFNPRNGSISNSGTLYIGRHSVYGTTYEGEMDEVVFAKRAMSATEIEELFDAADLGSKEAPATLKK